MIASHYNEMWQRFTDSARANCLTLDPFIHSSLDTRRGITALSYIDKNSQQVADKISEFLTEVHKVEPEQYFYPRSDLHITMLSIISCIEDFTLSKVNIDEYIKAYNHVVAECPPVEINFIGVTASESCIVIQGFPVDNNLHTFRKKLRQAFKSLPNTTFDSRYKLITAHCTAIRFCRPIKDSQRLFELCQANRERSFGSIVFNQFELVYNNWYQQRTHTELLACAKLNNR
ncbi:hypothetical protein Q4489_16220 [Thalassotalea sp. 1_MG-2023]|uniref:hypothetical protein n=1 Tax=Thalassotalea sp. 1_MG-2023 TaxID=3062680 RepID=UPI0026E40397|nr:hypothetical protein [Thalassotalea sp. 1_MG-2023]MDO6428559.1 hypothetical protein [Thalassotalea sp. 1_MG-2023]